MKLSKHSILRMKQRTDCNHKDRKKFYKDALKYGKSYGTINDERLRNYLLSKETNHSRAKLYKGYVFIHSKNSKQLYTMYKLPDKFGGG